MTREIKFRAWNGNGMEAVQDIRDEDFVVGKDDVLMQYTGLRDKNGKEIYEGDILKGTKEDLWEVYFRERWASFCLTWNGTTTLFGENFLAKESEIIGNIYENPELLTNQ